ncbi:hypothetical protein XENOCAPTIV_010453, partial [Xenoophorus captivus]
KRKFIIECRGSRKKYIFITERSRIAKYLCNLCSAQHKFNNEMSSRQLSHSLISEDNIVQYAAVCRAQSSQLKSLSCSETPQDNSGMTTPQEGSLTKLCNDVSDRSEARVKYHRYFISYSSFNNPNSIGVDQKPILHPQQPEAQHLHTYSSASALRQKMHHMFSCAFGVVSK